MNSEILEMREIIVRVLNGEASQDDRWKLVTWLGQDPENLKEFKQTESIWNALEILADSKEFSGEKAFERFSRLITEREAKAVPEKMRWMKSLDWIIRIAAIVVIVAGAALLFHRTRTVNVPSTNSICEITVPKGSRSQITLPDGTQVWLNAGSTLKYPSNFFKGDRKVVLTGEAYFDVKKYPEKRFIVNTSDIAIQVWGTKFNVKAYPEEPTIKTTLVEGSISIKNLKNSGSGKETYLVPNQVAIYYKDEIVKSEKSTANEVPLDHIAPSTVQINNEVNTILFTSWKDEKWVIEGVELGSLALELERRYNVNIQFKNESIKDYRFNGILANETFEQVLEIIKVSAPINYVISQDQVLLDEDLDLKTNYDRHLNH